MKPISRWTRSRLLEWRDPTAAPDAVKNGRAEDVRGTFKHGLALRRAGIGYVEVVAGDHTPAELRRVVERLVRQD